MTRTAGKTHMLALLAALCLAASCIASCLVTGGATAAAADGSLAAGAESASLKAQADLPANYRAIVKFRNPIAVTGKTVILSADEDAILKASQVFDVRNAQGAVTYAKKSGDGRVSVSENGTVTVKKGLKMGSYRVKVKVTAAGNDSYRAKTVTRSFRLKVRNPNTLTVKGKSASVKVGRTVVLVRPRVLFVSRAKGRVVYEKVSGSDRIAVTKYGNVTVKKGLRKGTYKVGVKVTAAGNGSYAPKSTTVAFTVKVRASISG